jgi:hypothetical protein
LDVVAPASCDAVGTLCADGTVYAGLDEADGRRLYTTPCDFGQTFASGRCTGDRQLLPFNNGNTSGGVFVGATSASDGARNTSLLGAADADSSVPGFQPHLAARGCIDLRFGSASDWFLPARDQLRLLYTNQTAIGNFNGTFYWSSTETHSASEPLNAAQTRFTDGYEYVDGDKKPDSNTIRCMRKGA